MGRIPTRIGVMRTALGSRLSRHALRVLATLCLDAGARRRSMSARELAGRYGDGVRETKRALAELRTTGWISPTLRDGRGVPLYAVHVPAERDG